MSGPTVLVTGATGFLGSRLVAQLTRQGFRVRAFVRRTSNTARLQATAAMLHFGDVKDVESLSSAMKGVTVVVHAAADTSGDAQSGQLITVQGTRNVIQAAMAGGIRQLIYLSSCSVYGITDCQPWQRIDETGPIERHPEMRGHYSEAKLKAEQDVLAAMGKGALKVTCLRPGTIWGPGGETFTPMMGFKVGRRLIGIIGSGRFILPLVYLDNLVAAILTCIDHPGAYDQIFNVVDPTPVDKNTYTRKVLKPLFPGALFFRIPYWALYATVACQEVVFKALGRRPVLSRYRLVSSQRPVKVEGGKIARQLGWSPPMGFDAAVQEVLRFERGQG
ncbi:NAD-dependent epimerase/dehydratase family protein [Desulfatitalea alkaliphila]|uniref:NAD-dependent epimerase/dehydratase family protein n=1 Tax=Desulfatitalea alkaliphila TaxID=2929485 RepID=A0AA41RDW1_9BACT|nr:NAD-dependent epimerase/dehydratase family protein [Desulfatitalea alkaliphila]MCJ8503003.1 NAD-dependent epimerase/dehydratase family protein [Desulfatitalea alkaliphila]